jgi:hypothetical protein
VSKQYMVHTTCVSAHQAASLEQDKVALPASDWCLAVHLCFGRPVSCLQAWCLLEHSHAECSMDGYGVCCGNLAKAQCAGKQNALNQPDNLADWNQQDWTYSPEQTDTQPDF